jgi:hypothetical protein
MSIVFFLLTSANNRSVAHLFHINLKSSSHPSTQLKNNCKVTSISLSQPQGNIKSKSKSKETTTATAAITLTVAIAIAITKTTTNKEIKK